jgi:hypothetical protein
MYFDTFFLQQWANDFDTTAAPIKNLIAAHRDAGCALVWLAQGTHRRFANAEHQSPDIAPVDCRSAHRTGLRSGIDRGASKRFPGHGCRGSPKRLHFGVSRPVARINGRN